MRISNVYVLLIAFVHHEVGITACVLERLSDLVADVLVLITLLTSLPCGLSDRVYLSNGL